MKGRRVSNPQISVIVPVYNEEENVGILYSELLGVINNLQEKCEIIFVNDGSTDLTAGALDKIYCNKSSVSLKIVHLRKRFGQTQAFQAGVDNAQGEILVFLDGDLQNDPKDIPLVLEKLKEGWDLVNGWRKSRKDSFFSKCLPSLIANFLIRQCSKIKLHDFGCTLKVFKKEILSDYLILSSAHRMLPLYVAFNGYRVTEVVVSHRKRTSGRSKYGFLRTYEVILELFRINFFEQYYSFPLYYFGVPAFILIILGAALGTFEIAGKIFLNKAWLSTFFFIAVILFFLGIQILLLGLLAEIAIRSSLGKSRKRCYLVRDLKA